MRHAPSHPWKAWRGESSHIKVLSRKKKKKKLASACPTIPACREVVSDRTYFLPGKQHYFHFLLHCRLSSRCAVSISKQCSQPLCTCPSMSAYLHRRTENERWWWGGGVQIGAAKSLRYSNRQKREEY